MLQKSYKTDRYGLGLFNSCGEMKKFMLNYIVNRKSMVGMPTVSPVMAGIKINSIVSLKNFIIKNQTYTKIRKISRVRMNPKQPRRELNNYRRLCCVIQTINCFSATMFSLSEH